MFETEDVDAEVILVGRSNVGKSSLMRELTGKKFDVGRRPGVTLEPNQYVWGEVGFAVTDMPGFGFMEGVAEERVEEIKDGIVRYVETHRDRILVAVHVVDAKAFVDIVDRWSERGEVPYDVDLHHFLRDEEVPTVVAVNKIDKVDEDGRDERLDDIADRLGYPPPWRQWRDVVAPISAKRGSIQPLLDALRKELKDQKRHDLLKFF